MRPLRRAEEARQNIEAMRASGAKVSFWSVDLADAASVSQALQQVRNFWGPISGVVHGAGVEESRLIADKDAKLAEAESALSIESSAVSIAALSTSETEPASTAASMRRSIIARGDGGMAME